ncbi:MAG: FAD-dependent oxidoreductase [Proteobacteria bacterium]|nr:FAD-dependent oxidoreductase [Pseudomonadota bacterium]
MSEWDTQTDVLVIGAGGCGLVAALAAAEAGAAVIVVEKRAQPGGTLARDDGAVPAAGTRFQRAAGIDDDSVRFARDLAAYGGDHDMPALAHRLAAQSAALVEWLVDVVGARLTLLDEAPLGHSAPRLHAPPSCRGEDLRDDLVSALARRGVPIWLGWPVHGLIDGDDGMVGAVAEAGPSAIARVGAKKLVLASGGFAGAPQLVRRFCSDATTAADDSAPGSTGDALRWGAALGAAIANIGAYQRDPVTGALWRTQGGLMVDGDGRVLRRDGRAIANLFAGGGAAAGISGRHGSAGYLAGNGLLSALGLGWLAGRAAAREIAAAR